MTPEKIVADRHGNLYVLDSAGTGVGIPAHITKLSPSGTPLAKWGTERWVWNPRTLTADPHGNLYILGADLLEISPTGRDVAHWDIGGVHGLWGWMPTDLAVDGGGILYLCGLDWTQRRRFVARLELTRPRPAARWALHGDRLKLLALWTSYEPRSSIPPRSGGSPTIAVDSYRIVYVTEPGGVNPTMPGGSIYKLSPTGRVLAAWRIGGVVSSVALDRQDNLYVAAGTRIQKISPQGKPLTVYGSGVVGLRSVAVDGQGNVLAVINSGLVKFSPAGRLLATWS
jgi:hypothetical protein